MPILKQHASMLVRGVRILFSLEAGVVRNGGSPRSPSARLQGSNGRTQQAAERTRKREQARRALTDRDREASTSRARPDGDAAEPRGVAPEKIIWIFGTGRSGNTWLSAIMEGTGHTVWREPSIGRLFGEFYYFTSREGQRGTSNFVLGDKQRKVWLRSIRNFVLEGANGRFPELPKGYLVIKEQVGSVGAPLLMEALPESRMILLIRDPRDVVASWINASREGGWRYERLQKRDPNWSPVADEDPAVIAGEWASHYLRNVSKAREAYKFHRGYKVLVKYEDLRNDTLGTVRRIYSELGVEIDEEELARAVKKHAWENVPEEEKGEGKFHRKAKPGGWREDLTPEQAKMVEKVTAPLIEEFYPD